MACACISLCDACAGAHYENVLTHPREPLVIIIIYTYTIYHTVRYTPYTRDDVFASVQMNSNQMALINRVTLFTRCSHCAHHVSDKEDAPASAYIFGKSERPIGALRRVHINQPCHASNCETIINRM